MLSAEIVTGGRRTLAPSGMRTGTPVQLHVGANDPFAPPEQMVAFRDSAERAGAVASVHHVSPGSRRWHRARVVTG
jgi:hypothetical protein